MLEWCFAETRLLSGLRNALAVAGRFAVSDGIIENRSGRTLEEFQHQVQSVFLCDQISYSDRRTNSTVAG
jgi:hypothetical protein